MQPDFAAAPEVREATSLVNEVAAHVSDDYAIVTAEDFTAGAEHLKLVKGAQKKIESLRVSITKPINDGLKAVNDMFRRPAEQLVEVEMRLKRALTSYEDEQRRIRLEEQRRADEAARKERERIEAQARRAAEAGKPEKAAQLEERAATVVAPVIQREPPKVSGLSSREVWRFEIADEKLVPREYMVVDPTKVRAVVNALKGAANIPGVRVWSEKSIAAGAA
jgi:hypothetical protein